MKYQQDEADKASFMFLMASLVCVVDGLIQVGHIGGQGQHRKTNSSSAGASPRARAED